MYSQAIPAVEAKERRAVLKNNPVETASLRETPSLSLVDCPDPVSCPRPERAEEDREASLTFLHYLVMGPTRAHMDSQPEREV